VAKEPVEQPSPDQSKRPGNDAIVVLKLYVTGSTSRSMLAIENIRRLCETRLRGCYHLEVIDIYQNPEAARDAQIIAVPTLIKTLPKPLRRVIGDLSDEAKVLAGLSIDHLRMFGEDPS
jgi:circadian clock protein KaiB